MAAASLSIPSFERTAAFLGLYEHRGNRANNILNLFDLEGGSIFVDPSADAAARYKLVAGAFYGPEMVREFQRGHPDFLLGPAVTENRGWPSRAAHRPTVFTGIFCRVLSRSRPPTRKSWAATIAILPGT
jgi:hypothetical protein